MAVAFTKKRAIVESFLRSFAHIFKGEIMVAAAQRVNARYLRENEKKWMAPMMKAGWTAVPSVILEFQDELGLNPVELNVLMQLASHWWYQHNLPHPSKKRIAKRIARSEATVQRTLRRLEERGLIERIPWHDPETGAQRTNHYAFTGLIEKATPFAVRKIEDKKSKSQGKSGRKPRIGPTMEAGRLRVVPSKQ
jgi:hypothetical protein